MSPAGRSGASERQADTAGGVAGRAWADRRARAAFALAACLFVGVLWESQRLFRADWASMAERQSIVEWAGGSAQPADDGAWREARAAMEAALAITPDDPDLVQRMGDLYLVAGRRNAADAGRRKADFAEAARFYRRATDLRPTEPTTWAGLAAAAQAAGQDAATVNVAWARALALGPYDAAVQPVLMQVLLTDWDGATPAMRNWANRLFDLGNESTRRDINALAAGYGWVFTPDADLPPP